MEIQFLLALTPSSEPLLLGFGDSEKAGGTLHLFALFISLLDSRLPAEAR